jgi:hypothetical protein
MTIVLAPQTEAKLRQMVEREGRDANTHVDDLLAESLDDAARLRRVLRGDRGGPGRRPGG